MSASWEHVDPNGGGCTRMSGCTWPKHHAGSCLSAAEYIERLKARDGQPQPVRGDGHVFLAYRGDPLKRCIACGEPHDGPHSDGMNERDQLRALAALQVYEVHGEGLSTEYDVYDEWVVIAPSADAACELVRAHSTYIAHAEPLTVKAVAPVGVAQVAYASFHPG